MSDLLGTTGPVVGVGQHTWEGGNGRRRHTCARTGQVRTCPTVGHVLADARKQRSSQHRRVACSGPWRGSVPRVQLAAPQLVERPDKGQSLRMSGLLSARLQRTAAERCQSDDARKTDLNASKYTFAYSWLGSG